MSLLNKANVRVLVRVRPLNDRELRFNPSSSLVLDDRSSNKSSTNGENRQAFSIDF